MIKWGAMANMQRQMVLNAFLMPAGHQVAAWRHPEAAAAGGADFNHYKRLAQAAEAALFDSIFVADFAMSVGEKEIALASRTASSAFLEPMTLLSGLAAVAPVGIW